MPATTGDLRELLLAPEDAAAMDVRGRIDAAVLVPLLLAESGLVAVFTRRREDLSTHAGEISFPGGRQDIGEEDLRETALREAEEEIGLARSQVELVGALPPTPTIVTNYAIYPFVGVVRNGVAFRPNPSEVDEVLQIALGDLAAGYGRRRLLRRGVPVKTDTYVVGDNLIWGATARIVGALLERLGPLM